jgi:phage-related protein
MKVGDDIVRKVLFSDEFVDYYDSLNSKIQDKYSYAIQIIRTQKVVSGKFVKKIQSTEFYEVRVSVGTNEYRTMLVTTDNPNFMEAKQVILLNSFLKKDNKQYQREIEKARTIIEREEMI